MAPIHDSDIAENRWSQAEWRHYELWEKVEFRARKRKWLWIGLTVMLFLVLSAVPIVADRWTKWTSVTAVRRLSQEINRVKKDAGVHHMAFRLRFAEPDGRLSYTVEKAASCSAAEWTPVRSGTLLSEPRMNRYLLLEQGRGAELGIPGLVNTFCYDALAGSQSAATGQNVIGFGAISAKDLTEKRMDRLAIVLLTGPSAEISFE